MLYEFMFGKVIEITSYNLDYNFILSCITFGIYSLQIMQDWISMQIYYQKCNGMTHPYDTKKTSH